MLVGLYPGRLYNLLASLSKSSKLAEVEDHHNLLTILHTFVSQVRLPNITCILKSDFTM